MARTSRMTLAGAYVRWSGIAAGIPAILLALAGCRVEKRVEPVLVADPNLSPMAIAVAPAVNLSGSTAFDRNRFADLMAVELGHFSGVTVIPVSRVLGVLAVQGSDGVESPDHALELADVLGADAILVFAVTDYDPYDPPRVAISAQLYGTRPRPGGRQIDPVALSRQAALAASPAEGAPRGLLGQAQRVFDASREGVVDGIKGFAEWRNAGNSPYGWRRYVVSQQHFIRYCCHAMLRELLNAREETMLAEGRRER